jgi:hypothetical protein
MTGPELRQHFTHPRTEHFQTREFMANFIWEYYHLMRRGLRQPVMGNLRTFWYILKPTLARAFTASENEDNQFSDFNSEKHYAQLLQVFQRMIVRYRLFSFHDFDFTDEGQRFYALGSKHPDIILVSEKNGHFRRLQMLQKEFGVTIISLGGMPSVLTSEYFSDLLKSSFPASRPLKIISIVDYNPSGAIILKSFAAQLAHQGHKHLASVQNLLTPEIFTPDELKAIVEPIPMKSKADQTKARRWLKAGGGINGQPLGLESEALVLDMKRFRQVFLDALGQLSTGVSVPSPVVKAPSGAVHGCKDSFLVNSQGASPTTGAKLEDSLTPDAKQLSPDQPKLKPAQVLTYSPLEMVTTENLLVL